MKNCLKIFNIQLAKNTYFMLYILKIESLLSRNSEDNCIHISVTKQRWEQLNKKKDFVLASPPKQEEKREHIAMSAIG